MKLPPILEIPELIEKIVPLMCQDEPDLICSLQILSDYFGEEYSDTMRLTDWIALLNSIDWAKLSVKNQDSKQKSNNLDENLTERRRAKNYIIRVTFPDGTVFCDKHSSQTFVQTIKKIGSDVVAAMNIEYCHTKLLAREKSSNKNYAEAQVDLGDGYYLFTQGASITRFILMKHISKELGLGLIIERDENIKPITNIASIEGRSIKKKPKASLLVILENGELISETRPRDTFFKTMQHIGFDKIRRLSIDIQGHPSITRKEKNDGKQLEIGNGEYLTIPTSTKQMYKYIKIISSMCHVRLDVRIIS